jgi:hypothetical protein
MVFQKGTWEKGILFLLLPVLRKFFFYLLSLLPGKGFYSLPDEKPLQGIGIHVSHICTAKGATLFADGTFLKGPDFCLKVFIESLEFFFLIIPVHGFGPRYLGNLGERWVAFP